MASNGREAERPMQHGRTVAAKESAGNRRRQDSGRSTGDGGSGPSAPGRRRKYDESDEEEEQCQLPKKVRIVEGCSAWPQYDANERPIKSEPVSPVCPGLLVAGQ